MLWLTVNLEKYSLSSLYVLLLCYHAFAIVVVVKNKKNESMNEFRWDKILKYNFWINISFAWFICLNDLFFSTGSAF